ncbi:phospholipase D-like domain-containing protein [Candidatus Paracaedibacter symbiosus]|uniref:phospholipase D-like domain-containing protein n=1 Tax=Candidatus Paracaedibacter symbiosus TaxID=244582 RepID=UPI00050997C9|nr:phospholipase D-like domain-containing protein [Candidatus Paracaedibacter symbiosus]
MLKTYTNTQRRKAFLLDSILKNLLDYQYNGGSYNFSKGAYKRNAENLLVIHDKTVTQEYVANWQNRWDHSLNPSHISCGLKLKPLSKK